MFGSFVLCCIVLFVVLELSVSLSSDGFIVPFPVH